MTLKPFALTLLKVSLLFKVYWPMLELKVKLLMARLKLPDSSRLLPVKVNKPVLVL